MSERCRVGFVMEQTLGHVTHDRNLRAWARGVDAVDATWMPVEFSAEDRWQSAPGIRGNWTLRASLRARDRVAARLRQGPLDSLFYHTQVTALFGGRFMRRIPTVVSLDATPINVDSVGEAYDHAPSGNPAVEALKNSLNRRSFHRARHLVTWCQWAKDSLVRDYGVEAGKVSVIPPGVDIAQWDFERADRRTGRPLRLLFVGGDFRRKGGATLLSAFRDHLAGDCELDIATKEEVDTSGISGVRVHHGLTPNSEGLRALYAAADLFVFPTEGDCLPIAVMEAMASGLPVVSTSVGALNEEVIDGVNGVLVPIRDPGALGAAVRRFVDDPELARAMGAAGRKLACERFNGAVNYRAVLDLCGRVANADA